MDAKSLALTMQHRQTLDSISTLAQSKVLDLIDAGSTLDKAAQAAIFKTAFADIIAPYTELAAGVSSTYYDDLRLISQMENQFKYTDLTAPNIKLDLTKELTFILLNIGIDIILNNRFGVRDKAVDFFTSAAQKIVYQTSHEVIDKRGSQDPAQKKTTRVAQANACAYCIAGTMDFLDPTPTGKFHDNCRCVTAVYFEGDDTDKFVQNYNKEFEENYSKAGDYIKAEKAFEKSVKHLITSDDLYVKKSTGKVNTNKNYTYIDNGVEFKRRRYFETFESYLEVMRSEYGYK